mmetsp:Transcript_6307/g.11206  ORF Transcript_6307/g.11206 Transcript_6307/m.11206 type:complete len:834 (-) Transcript_6307:171-2672(-)
MGGPDEDEAGSSQELSRRGAMAAAALLAAYSLRSPRWRAFAQRLFDASDGSTPLVVRHGRLLCGVLGASALALIASSRNERANEKEEEEHVAREIEKYQDRLLGVIKASIEALGDESFPGEEIDVEVILDATEKLASVTKSDAMLSEGLHVAARCVAWNLKRLEFLGQDLGTQQTDDLLRQLEYEERIIDAARLWFVRLGSIRARLGKHSAKARAAMRMRTWERAKKTLSLLERSRSQLPYLAASSALSVLNGSISALRSHYTNQVTALAFAQVSKTGHSSQTIPDTIATLATLEVLSLLCNFVGTKLKAMGRKEFILSLKTELFRALITQDLAFFETNDLYEMRQIVGSSYYVCTTLFDLPINTIENVSSMVATLVMLMGKSRSLSWALFFLLPFRFLVNEGLEKLENRLAANLAPPSVENMRDIWPILVNPVGMRTMRSFGREPIETAIFSQGLRNQKRTEDQNALIYQIFEAMRTVVEKGVDVSALAYGGQLAATGDLDAADVSSFTTAASFAFERARVIYYQFKGLFEHNGILHAAEKMQDLLQNKPSIGVDSPPYSSMPADDRALSWSVELENVSFAYATRPQVETLRDISLKVKEGERVGILGESGCGKSTLISLISRLYDPSEGIVRICDQPIAEFNPLWLRRRIAIVSQSIYLPFRTVKENLMYGMAVPSTKVEQEKQEAEMLEALRIAQCENFVKDKTRFPQLWHTDIGRDGSTLSGGERQRLCIARAILAQPRILILDEATSALDEESQYQIQETIEALYKQSGNRLTIMTIAHRLSNFRHIDRLVVLEKGKIIEEGTPSELAQLENGIFASFLKRATIAFSK